MVLLSILFAACSSPAPFDPGGVETETDEGEEAQGAGGCASDIVLVYPTGERSPVPCESASIQATMEFDPDDPPELRTLAVTIDGSSSAGFQCSLAFTIEGVCGPEDYWIGDKVSLSAETWDCSGTPDAFEGSLSADDGAIELTRLETTDEVGDLTGDSVPVRVVGAMQLTLPGGVRMEGAFDVRRTVIGEDAEEQECAVSGPVVASPIRGGELMGSWSNGGASQSYSYVLDLGGGITPADCPRCDRAGNLRFRDVEGTPPRDRSGEVTAFGVRTETGEAYEQDATSGTWVLWGSGRSNGAGWSGSRSMTVGGRTTYEDLQLSW